MADASVPRVTVRLPTVLAPLVGEEREIGVQGATLAEALADLARVRPAVGAHLFDEAGVVRPNVACFHNDDYVRTPDAAERAVAEGDRITIVNAISGG